MCGYHQVWGCGFGCGGFGTHGRLLLRLLSIPFRGYCGFGLRILKPGIFPGGGHFRLLRSLRDLLRRGLGCGLAGGVVEDLATRTLGRRDSTPHPVPSARQRDWQAGLSERHVGLWRCSFGCDLALALQGLPSPPSIYTAAVVRCVVTPTSTALRQFPRGGAFTVEVGVPTSDAPRCVFAVALRVAEALAALTLHRSLWSHVRLHRHSQTAEMGD